LYGCERIAMRPMAFPDRDATGALNVGLETVDLDGLDVKL